MSYQVLARKWRPKNFSEVAGQAHVLKSLINALDNQRLHHAYLLTGTRGVGKTTLARILAKCLNCERGIRSNPCDECSSCLEISEGRFIDLIEVDAASRTKVEDTRELLENVQYLPSRGRFKIYLIDEVHMLSTHSFNALLKTLEEPPLHVKFLFATTDPQKLPITVLSRCLQFNLKNLSPRIVVEHLKKVLNFESIEFDEDALWQIAAAASGSMRDALTLLDQGVSYCQGKIKAAGIVEMLGVPHEQQVFALLEAMACRDIEELLKVIDRISDQTPDYNYALERLLSTLHRLAVAQAVPSAIDNSFGDKEKITELAERFSAEDVQLYYQMGCKGRDDLKFAMDLKSAFEMLVLRMLIFSPVANISQEERQIVDDLKKKTNLDCGIDNTKKNIDLSFSTQEPVGEIDEKLRERFFNTSNDNSGQIGHQTWLELYTQLDINGIAANVFSNTEFKKRDGKTFCFLLNEEQSSIYSEDLLPKLSLALSEKLGEQVSVNIEIGVAQKETPAALLQRLKREAREEMIDEFENDENVQEMLKHFSAKLARESISPVKE